MCVIKVHMADTTHVLHPQAEHAGTLADDEEGLMGAIEKYITKQVGAWAAVMEGRAYRFVFAAHHAPRMLLRCMSCWMATHLTCGPLICLSIAGAHDTAA